MQKFFLNLNCKFCERDVEPVGNTVQHTVGCEHKVEKKRHVFPKIHGAINYWDLQRNKWKRNLLTGSIRCADWEPWTSCGEVTHHRCGKNFIFRGWAERHLRTIKASSGRPEHVQQAAVRHRSSGSSDGRLHALALSAAPRKYTQFLPCDSEANGRTERRWLHRAELLRPLG